VRKHHLELNLSARENGVVVHTEGDSMEAKYKVVCVPEKMRPDDLVELAILFNTRALGWMDGYLYIMQLQWNERKPYNHYVTEIAYAKCEYRRYAILTKDRDVKFSSSIDHLNASIRVIADNPRHPLRKAILQAIKEVDQKL